MADKYAQYIGNWISVTCKDFTCTGKIEKINDVNLILSNANLKNAKIPTKYVGIDIKLIVQMDFIKPLNLSSQVADEITLTNSTPKLLNVYTSETQPPPIKRGGSSSAVNRSFTRQISTPQEKFSKIKNASFSDFNSSSRKNSVGNNNEPAWLNSQPDCDFDKEFDFDKNLALFDKNDLFGNNKRYHNENSDSSDSVGLKMNNTRQQPNFHAQSRKARSNTISFESGDFSQYHDNSSSEKPVKMDNYMGDPTNKRDILSEFKHIGIIPSSSIDDKCHEQPAHNFAAIFQQPDLVREITQRQLKLSSCDRFSVISIKSESMNFSFFNEFWNLENNTLVPVFTIEQRDLLFETAGQLGIDSKMVDETVGETISEFVITQVGGFQRINGSNLNQVPRIAILVGKCSASIYAIFVTKYLLKKGCHVLVYVDENQSSDINYRMIYEIKTLKTLFLKNDVTSELNFVTNDVKDLNNKTFDYVISGVESDSSQNNPSYNLKRWSFKQKAHILCINPPKTSCLMWRNAVFIGVPTFSHKNLNIVEIVPRNDNRRIDACKQYKKPDGLILLCNSNISERVFSFLHLSYQSPFTSKNWIRLNRENDLCLVE